MNSTDRAELNRCRQEWWDQYAKVIKFAAKEDVEKAVEAMDRHQEIISKDGQEIAE